MTVDEFLTQNKPILKVMVMNGLSLDLGRCAGMVQVYEKAKAEHGSRYAVELCKDRYSIKTRARFFQLLRVLKRDLP